MKLTEKDVTLLATLYEMPHWTVFKKHFMADRQMEIAQLAPFSPDHTQTSEYKGRILEIREMDKKMTEIHENQNKKRKRK